MKESSVIVMVGGVGYKVFLSAYTLGKLAGRQEVMLYTYTYVREDTLALYGFLSEEELGMFELLISVSGIGPKAALGILSIADVTMIRTAILNQDSSILTKVSGVGKKTAERVILELQNKVAALPEARKAGAMMESDALDALLAMGYGVSEAREALKSVSSDIKDVGERVKLALRSLGKK